MVDRGSRASVGLVLMLAGTTLACEGSGERDARGRAGVELIERTEPAPAEPREPRAPAWVGVIVPTRAVELTPLGRGAVEAVLVETGERVVEGQVLAELDTDSVRTQIDEVEAELLFHRARLGRAKVDREQREAELDALRVLESGGHVAEIELDEARFELRRAKVAVAEAGAEIAEAQARVSALRRQLDDCSLTAPFAGVIAERYLDAGAVAGPQAPVLRLIAGEQPRVRFAVEPAQAEDLGLGHRVRVRSEVGGLEAGAVVVVLAPTLDPASELMFVDAEVEASLSELPVGTAALVDLRERGLSDAG